ncbi:MAG: hypothetical protein ACYC4H_09625 [Desulfocucumaceae bacterium]
MKETKKITPEEARVLAAYRVMAKIAIRRAQKRAGLDKKQEQS